MSRFEPFSPRRAVELVEAAGIVHAHRLIVDFAAAGQLRSEALVIETATLEGERVETQVEIPKGLWKRIVQEGVEADVWAGGTVSLASRDQSDTVPAVSITGIRFHVLDLHRLVRSQRGSFVEQGTEPEAATAPNPCERVAESAIVPDAVGGKLRKSPDPAVIPPGALLATVKQAQAALGYGRTKINELMNAGRLERVDDVGGTRITVASIRALAGKAD